MDVERTIEFLLQNSGKHDQQIRDINITLARVADLQVTGMEMQVRAHEDWEARWAVQQQERLEDRKTQQSVWEAYEKRLKEQEGWRREQEDWRREQEGWRREQEGWRKEQEDRWKAADIRSARIDAQLDRLGERIDKLVSAVGVITTRLPEQ